MNIYLKLKQIVKHTFQWMKALHFDKIRLRHRTMTKTKFVEVAMLTDIPAGKSFRVDVGSMTVLLCNANGQIYAIESECSHAQQSLECGIVRMGFIVCPAHGARFDLETGEPLSSPATKPIRIFPVKIENGAILLDISSIA